MPWHTIAFCFFLVASIFGFYRRDPCHGFGWAGLALLNFP